MRCTAPERKVQRGHRSDHRIKLAIVGRPNVGKSTLINTLLGEERVIAFDMPGTTRDAIEIDFDRDGKRYTLIDTAGLRKRGKVFEAVEKFSVIKTLQAIEASNVVLLMLDAQTEISEQDAHIAGFVLETGRAVVVAINKWDGLDGEQTRSASSASSTASCASCRSRACTPSRRCAGGHQALLKSVNRGARRGVRQAVHAQAHARTAGRGRTAAAAAQGHLPVPRCATRTRADRIRRWSSSTATRWTPFPIPIAATSKRVSAMRSTWPARRCASNSSLRTTPTRRIS